MADVVQFRSRERTRVESAWAEFAPSARLERVDPHFSIDWRSVAFERVSFAEYRLNASVSSSARPVDQLLVCHPRFAKGWIRNGRRDLPLDRPWISDGREVSVYWEDAAEVRAVAIDPRWAQETARQITGDDRLRLRVTSAEPTDTAAGGYWTRTMARLADEAAHPALTPLVTAELLRHALMTTLAAFPGTLQEQRGRPAQTSPAHATVRRAIVYIEEHAHEPVTIDDIARAVHISTRGLQYAFQRVIGSTPRAQLRRARLDGAHRDLLCAVPEDTVASIARRWGFTHPSRFAADYRAAFGVKPSDSMSRL